jgi:hypothetical protein
MTSTTGAFDFEDNGRTYRCHVEALSRGRGDAWWWFGVTGDDSRYAPFQVGVDDTPASVRPRVVAYYEDRMARRRGVPRD